MKRPLSDSQAKARYRKLCILEPSIPIFSTDWWLDAVCEGGVWDVVLVEQGGNVLAAMPYFIRKRLGFRLLTHPPLTQTLGPWFRSVDPNTKYTNILAQQKDMMEELIGKLPPFDYFLQNWHYSHTNWQPFYWRGFQQTTRYTYVLPALDDSVKIWAGLQLNIRREIKKASHRYRISVRHDLDIGDLLILNRMNFVRQGIEQPYSDLLVHRLDAACAARGCRRILIAEDAEGRRHAGSYIIWDANSAYYIIGGAAPSLRNSGATSLCMWEAIQYAGIVTKRFDFEGSMIEPFERFFRAFGAIQTPYYQITKTPSLLLRTREALLLLLSRSRS